MFLNADMGVQQIRYGEDGLILPKFLITATPTQKHKNHKTNSIFQYWSETVFGFKKAQKNY